MLVPFSNHSLSNDRIRERAFSSFWELNSYPKLRLNCYLLSIWNSLKIYPQWKSYVWREGFKFCDASTTFCNSDVPQNIKKHELEFQTEFRPTHRRFLYNTKKYFYFLENPHHLNIHTSSAAVFWHAAIIIFYLTLNTHEN